MPFKGLRDAAKHNPVRRFCHSPESWTQLWEDVFRGEDKDVNDRVKVETELTMRNSVDHSEGWLLKWSVTRL